MEAISKPGDQTRMNRGSRTFSTRGLAGEEMEKRVRQTIERSRTLGGLRCELWVNDLDEAISMIVSSWPLFHLDISNEYEGEDGSRFAKVWGWVPETPEGKREFILHVSE